jgi:hypothetical protein
MNDGTLVFTGQQDRTQALRIVISDYLGHASPMQLSRVLAARGHEVLHCIRVTCSRQRRTWHGRRTIHRG